MAKQGSFKLAEDEKITAVMVKSGYIVDGIAFKIVDKNGNETTKWFFQTPDTKYAEISLGANEYITQISGTYGKYYWDKSGEVIATMKIHTNLNPNGYGPYGVGRETQDIKPFTTPTSLDGTIVGFSATYGPYLASIGIFAKSIERQGPYGSTESTNWSIETREGQRFSKVMVNHGYIVDGIGFEVTDAEGNPETKLFGGSGGSRSEIPLGPNEHITKISGEYGEYYNILCITSIKIYTDLRPTGYGPYGLSKNAKNVKPFSTLPLPGSLGFFGNYGLYLGSIGTQHNEVKEFGPYGRQS